MNLNEQAAQQCQGQAHRQTHTKIGQLRFHSLVDERSKRDRCTKSLRFVLFAFWNSINEPRLKFHFGVITTIVILWVRLYGAAFHLNKYFVNSILVFIVTNWWNINQIIEPVRLYDCHFSRKKKNCAVTSDKNSFSLSIPFHFIQLNWHAQSLSWA